MTHTYTHGPCGIKMTRHAGFSHRICTHTHHTHTHSTGASERGNHSHSNHSTTITCLKWRGSAQHTTTHPPRCTATHTLLVSRAINTRPLRDFRPSFSTNHTLHTRACSREGERRQRAATHVDATRSSYDAAKSIAGCARRESVSATAWCARGAGGRTKGTEGKKDLSILKETKHNTQGKPLVQMWPAWVGRVGGWQMGGIAGRVKRHARGVQYRRVVVQPYQRDTRQPLSLTQMAGACLNPSFEPRYPQPQEAVCATHTSQKRGQDGLSPTQPERWSGLLACDCGMMGGGSKRMCGEGGLAIPREALCVMRRRAPSCKNPVAPTQTNKQDE
jgi:hypothetical protein